MPSGIGPRVFPRPALKVLLKVLNGRGPAWSGGGRGQGRVFGSFLHVLGH
jgi:hypothetical protein